MFVKLNKISKHTSGGFYITEIVINSTQILFLSENKEMRNSLLEGKIELGLNSLVRFTDVSFSSGGERNKITVIGDPMMIETKILSSKKQLLRD
tara:strand:+ start:244 stop:525 length:282 start_codon:yes stop_codon:yes gene_type:complete